MTSSITCFGKSFTSEDERRIFFRDELQKKLPELRKIDGFPLGTDEDILNLSDPPYYTACPNPWLNDFISQWEEEKKQLGIDNKRQSEFVVQEPYASDVSEGKNNSIYNAHSYHTKVPHPAIMRYILHYTQPGDIVFDGFAGTGMTGVASQVCGNPDSVLKNRIESEFKRNGLSMPTWGQRKTICGDLSPIASFISYNYNTPVDVIAFEQEAKSILREVETECSWMYETTHTSGQIGKINYVVWSDVFICPSCGHEIIFFDAAVDIDAGKVLDDFACTHCATKQTKRSVSKARITLFDKSLGKTAVQTKTVPAFINYTVNGKRFEKKPDKFDLDLLKKIDDFEIPYWFPIEHLPVGYNTRQPIESHGYTHVHHFFTKRNLFNARSIAAYL